MYNISIKIHTIIYITKLYCLIPIKRKEVCYTMKIFSKFIAKMKYKRSVRKTSKQLASCVNLYNKNEVRIKELQKILKEEEKGK